MYETLKKKIIQEFSDSEQTKITKLLRDIPFGDRKPSALLSEMRAKSANTQITDKLLGQLWIRNLPETIRAILSVSTDYSLDVQSAQADKVQESMNNGLLSNQGIDAISFKSGNSKITDLENQIATLKTEINALKQNRSRSRNRNRTPGPRNQSKQREICWYHTKFGIDAKKCNQPCNFKQNQEN